MASKPTVAMSATEVPNQRIYLVPQYPIRPDGLIVSFDRAADDLPKRMSRKAQYLGQVEWTWSPMHSRIDAYHLGLNPRKNRWVLWLSFFNDELWKFTDTHIAAWSPRTGMQGPDAAVHLLEAYWASEAAVNNGLDHFHWIAQEGLLAAPVLMEIARRVWKPGTEDGGGRSMQDRIDQSLLDIGAVKKI